MAVNLIIEDGSGVKDANGYIDEAFALEYLTNRGREVENGWSGLTSDQQKAAIIAATDYIENQFGLRFRGSKEFSNLDRANSTLTLTANPVNGESVTIGSVTYVFNTVLGGANSILIGLSPSTSLDNLIAAINLLDGIGVTYGLGTVVHPLVTASTFIDDAMVVTADESGTAGNLIVSTSTFVGGVWSSPTLTGGTDTGQPQPLSFPRVNLFDKDGNLIIGMPVPLKQATAEYAVRSVSTTLAPDPKAGGSGRIIRKKEKVSVIEEDTTYSGDGLDESIQSYPAADRLLKQYISSSSGVIRA